MGMSYHLLHSLFEAQFTELLYVGYTHSQNVKRVVVTSSTAAIVEPVKVPKIWTEVRADLHHPN